MNASRILRWAYGESAARQGMGNARAAVATARNPEQSEAAMPVSIRLKPAKFPEPARFSAAVQRLS
jgi:hypothetical protein